MRKPLPPGPGRPKGSPNKTTRDLKEAILEAARMVGEDRSPGLGLVGYLKHLAAKNEQAFATLLGKVVPSEMHVRTSVLDSLSDDELADFLVAVREARRARDQVTTHRHDPVH